MDKPRVLIIDDNPDVVHALTVLFTINDYECVSALDPQSGLAHVMESDVDLVIQDMNFTTDTTSGEEGVQLFTQLREIQPDLPIVLITAWTHLPTAVALVKKGAADYLSKPWDDDKLIVTANNLVQLGRFQRQHNQLTRQRVNKHTQLANQFDLCGIQYASQNMFELLSITTQVAHANVAVLITGPNGAGKEKIAEVVQANSSCKDGPFIKVNVGALPSELMEAELFGAEAGAYTGITKRRIGRFELAHKGTLFLDEIGNLSLAGQAKLLRVLETGEFERIGGSETIKVDVRIVSATNANLQDAITKGEFREDLYYRLNVIELKLPPLVERKDDIPLLAEFFLDDSKVLSREAVRALQQYHWPGNIRELKNHMQRASLLASDGTVTVKDLGLPVAVINKAASEVSKDLTKAQIDHAIATSNGIMADAARLLGISRPALYRRIKKLEQGGA